jgi:hypothetical protein
MMKHPDRIKADRCRKEAALADQQAQDLREQAGHMGGIAPKLSEAYNGAADGLETLAAALRDRAREFDESARAFNG